MNYRRFAPALALIVAAPIACSSDDDGGQPAAGAVDITIDTFNVAFAGAFIPNVSERRQPLLDGLRDSEADVLCLQEVWEQSDKDAVLAATSGRYPHTAWFSHDLNTPLDDAKDQQGQVPPAQTTPPCAGTDLEAQMNAGIDCLRDNCSTIEGSDEGQTTSTACAQKSCLAEVAALLLGTEEQQRCYTCVAVNLPSETFSEIRSACTTEVNAGLAFGGQSGVMILSKYPLSNAKDHVVPGTFNRRIFAMATATLPNGAQVDVHCNHLTPIFSDPTFPYTGDYGSGEDGAAGWEQEQLLQAGKLIDYVKQQSGSRPAVILGDMNAGYDFPDATPPIIGEGQTTLELLQGTFTPALTASYEPLCTYCDTNANNDTDAPSWIDHILLYNIDAAAVKESKRVYDEAIVPVEVDDGNGGTTTVQVPLSDHYGMRAVLSIPAP